MAEELTRKEIRVNSREELEQLRAIAAEDPEIEIEVVREVPGIAPLIIVAIIGGAAAIAGGLAHFIEVNKGGQIIDLREGQELTRRDKDVVYGLIVIIASDGKVTVEVKEPRGYFLELVKDVLDVLQGVATKTIEAAAEAAKGVVGDKGKVTTEALTRG